MIQLSIRDNAPVPCHSWEEAHKQIDYSFDHDGHTIFCIEADGFVWEEGDIHWKTFEAVGGTPAAMQGYFRFVGRA